VAYSTLLLTYWSTNITLTNGDVSHGYWSQADYNSNTWNYTESRLGSKYIGAAADTMPANTFCVLSH